MLRSLHRRVCVASMPSRTALFARSFNHSATLRMAEAASPAATEAKTKLTLRFATPTSILYSEPSAHSPPKHSNNQVDMVSLPGSEGVFGVLPNHPPTVAQMNPGLVTIQESADKPLVKYFISGGFATVKSDSTLSITVTEAVPLEEVDAPAVTAGLEKYRNEMERATDPVEKANAQIAFELATTLQTCLDTKA